MKKLISCLLIVMLLFTHAFAESTGRFGEFSVIRRFLKTTDMKTKDIALQIQSEGNASDLVIRVDGDNLHLVTRNNSVEDGHVQLNPTGIYLDSEGKVTLLRYATVTTVVQDFLKELDAIMEEAIQSIPEEEIPTEAEIEKALDEMGILADTVEGKAQADAATLSTAAIAFVNNFKPETILDVKQEMGSLEISLRSDAYATAMADAMDELMSNPDLAELVNRQAAADGGSGFAKAQQEWLTNREAVLDAIRSIKSTESIDEDGHAVSHFQIGEDAEGSKVLMCDTDAWIDAENDEANITVSIGFKDEDPVMVHELAVEQDSYREKLTSGDSMTETRMEFEDGAISSGNVLTVIEGNEALRAEFDPRYLFMRGPKGSISATVRETWTGKTRYELIAETAEGEESSITVDFYQEDDSLVCELFTSEPDQSAVFRISRIDKVDIKDLSASENINEITAEQIKAELEPLMKLFR